MVKVNNFGTDGKSLSQGTRMSNMKALSLMVQQLWSSLKFLKCRSKVRVNVTMSKILVLMERSSHKEYAC